MRKIRALLIVAALSATLVIAMWVAACGAFTGGDNPSPSDSGAHVDGGSQTTDGGSTDVPPPLITFLDGGINCDNVVGTVIFCDDFDSHDGDTTPLSVDDPTTNGDNDSLNSVSEPAVLSVTAITSKNARTYGSTSAGPGPSTLSFDWYFDGSLPAMTEFANVTVAGVTIIFESTPSGVQGSVGASNFGANVPTGSWVHIVVQVPPTSPGGATGTIFVGATSPFAFAVSQSTPSFPAISMGIVSGNTCLPAAPCETFFDDLVATSP